jgi:hypothetical protein
MANFNAQVASMAPECEDAGRFSADDSGRLAEASEARVT